MVRPNKKLAELTENSTEPSQSNFLSFSTICPGTWACFKKSVTKIIPRPTMGRLIQNIHLQDCGRSVPRTRLWVHDTYNFLGKSSSDKRPGRSTDTPHGCVDTEPCTAMLERYEVGYENLDRSQQKSLAEEREPRLTSKSTMSPPPKKSCKHSTTLLAQTGPMTYLLLPTRPD